MKKRLVMLITIPLAVNLTACSKPQLTENLHDNVDSQVPLVATLENENFISPFSEYYTDPDTGLEFKLHSKDAQNEYINYDKYEYVTRHVSYEGPYKSPLWSNGATYYLKKDTFAENYYNIFEYTFDTPYVDTCYFNFFEWLTCETTPNPNLCNYQLYKFEFDNSVPSIQLEKKSLKKLSTIQESIEDIETSESIETIESSDAPTIEYTDDQLKRYDKYREESDTEFIEDYLTNDLDHYEEDFDTVLAAIDLALQEAADEKAALLEARTKGEKIPDSDNVGYLLTYKFKDEDEETEARNLTLFSLIYGYDSTYDEFCVSIDGKHYGKTHNSDTDTYEDTAYDFESYLAALLSNFVRVTNEEVPVEEGISKTLSVFENTQYGNSIKIYNYAIDDLTYRPYFDFFTKTGDGIFDDAYKEKHFICKYNLLSEDAIEFIIKNYQYKEYYATFYTENATPYIAIALKPLLELKPGDPIIRFDIDIETQASTELLEQIIDELDSMEIIYSFTDQYHNQLSPDNSAEMNVHTGMFKESDVKNYYTYDLYNDVGIQVTVPEFYNSEFDNSEELCNVVEHLNKTSELGYSNADITFSRFVSSKEDIDSRKQYSEIVEEVDINGHHCYLVGTEYDDSCWYTVFIEAKPSQYVSIESIRLEGSYYYTRETCKESIKQLISLIKIK